MKPKMTSLTGPAMAVAAAAFCVAVGSVPAFAQSERCPDLYNRVMTLYQTAPLSGEYNQASAYYSSRCLAGPAAGPAAYQVPDQAPYPAYQQPVAVYPGAVIGVGVVPYDRGYRRDYDPRFR